MEKIKITELPNEPLVKKMESSYLNPKTIKIGALVIILLGIVSGYVLTGVSKRPANISSNAGIGSTGGQKTVGSTDTSLFPDTTEGELQAGGLNGEGTHHLVRPGGDSQTVYLTSSVLDLSQFVGKKVRIWGKTFAAKKAGWLMDVGKVQTLE